MYSSTCLLAAFLVQCSLVLSQSNKLEWTPEEMYNPVTEPRSCGVNSDQPAYICDPNGVLGDEIDIFQKILSEAANNGTRCPCSTHYCETYKGFTGYRIGVALVNKMKLQKGENNELNTPTAQAQIFAYHLENTKWKMGNCEEDIVIFYSLDDKVLAIYGGMTALKKLTPYYRELLAFKASNDFQKGKVADALHNVVFDLRTLLNCESTEDDCGIHEIRVNPNNNRNSGSQDRLSYLLSALMVTVTFFRFRL